MKLLVSRKTGKFFSAFFFKDLPWISRYRLNRGLLKEIKAFSPDIVLVYPNHLLLVCKQLSDYPIISLGPDCSSLNNMRALKDSYVYSGSNPNKYKAYLDNFRKQIYLEKELSKVVTKSCLVGIEDTILFNTITGTDKGCFIPHPHYRLKEKLVSLDKPKLKVLISGAYDISTYTDIRQMVEAFVMNDDLLKNYSFTFIGRGWNAIISQLSNLFEVNTITWVEDYTEEIRKYDIQIFPISYGVGTKGKVLDALAMGILCVGSYYAFENISVRNGEHCVIYGCAEQIIKILRDIDDNRHKYEGIAKAGQLMVRKYHSPQISAKYLMKIICGDSIDTGNVYYSRKTI